MIWEELDKNMIVTGLEAETYQDVMKQLGGIVIREGYAKETYIDALIEREGEFPTGLDIDGYGVAIPHTNPTHINKVGTAIAILKKPVTFIEMGTDDDEVQVRIVFMLAVKDPNAHIDSLQRIIGMLQDTALLERLLQATDADAIIQMIRDKEADMDACA